MKCSNKAAAINTKLRLLGVLAYVGVSLAAGSVSAQTTIFHPARYQIEDLTQSLSKGAAESISEEAAKSLPLEDAASEVIMVQGADQMQLDKLVERVKELEEMVDPDNQPAYTAEYDSGFKISPRDKKKTPFELKINGRLQFRWAAFANDIDTFTNRVETIDVVSRNDFEVERGRLEFKGYALDPSLKFYFNLDADTDDNHEVIFHDFWFDYDIADNATVRVGKAKVPSSYEWLESSTRRALAVG